MVQKLHFQGKRNFWLNSGDVPGVVSHCTKARFGQWKNVFVKFLLLVHRKYVLSFLVQNEEKKSRIVYWSGV